MVKSRQQTARKPATKYANLQKKMQKQMTQVKKKKGVADSPNLGNHDELFRH